MCGLAGIIGLASPANRQALVRMGAAMQHRGPDGEGLWEGEPDAQGQVPMLVHRRLSILDLSPAAAQPMVDPASGDVLVLNGEIYNYVALRRRLQADGQQVQSSGDTAVMLRWLSTHGLDALRTLRGMFACAWWDRSARQLVLARDPLGIKPLYLARNPDAAGNWRVAFASELRALLASGLLGQARLDPAAVATVVWNGFVVGPGTAVAGVQQVGPGECIVLDSAGREQKRHRFWHMPTGQAQGQIGTDELRAQLLESVRLHLASDVPLGIFLSGGVDSSAVANLAQRASPAPVHTFTLAFEEAQRNEGPYARRIAEAIGTQHRELLLTGQSFADRLDGALDCLDQPSFDALNSYFMSHAVRDAGFKVALVGTGGDELFGGYTSFRDLPRMRNLARLLRRVPQRLRLAGARAVARGLGGAPGAVGPQTRWAKLPDMVRRGDDLLGLYQMAYALFLPDLQEHLLGRAMPGDVIDGLPAPMARQLAGEMAGKSALEAISVAEHRLFLGERLLRDTDAASMSASIEVRLPLVDQVLLEQVSRLPEALRFHPLRAKALLRRLGLEGLDPQLFNRPKSGFELPFQDWLRGHLGRQVGEVLCDPALVRPAGLDPQAVAALWQAYQAGAPGLYWTRVWAPFVFIRWCHQHRVYL